MPKYVYTYFDARARGEPARMLFAAAGVPFEDRRLTQEEWPAIKPKTPGGSLPLLEVDGQLVTQSLVIFRFLARTFGFDGENLLDKTRVEEIVEYLVEFKNAGFKMMFAPNDEESQKKAKEELGSTFEKSCTRVESIISSNKSTDGWAVGKKMTFADIMLLDAFETAVARDAAVLDKFPKIKACRAKVLQADPKIKEYLSKRKETPF